MSDEILREILKEFRSLNKGLSKEIKIIIEKMNNIITRLINIEKNIVRAR